MLHTNYVQVYIPVIKAHVIACLALPTNIDCMITDMTLFASIGHTFR